MSLNVINVSLQYKLFMVKVSQLLPITSYPRYHSMLELLLCLFTNSI